MNGKNKHPGSKEDSEKGALVEKWGDSMVVREWNGAISKTFFVNFCL